MINQGKVERILTNKDPYLIEINGDRYSAFDDKKDEITKCNVGDKVKIFFKKNGQYRNVTKIEIMEQATDKEQTKAKRSVKYSKALTCTASVFKGCGNETDPAAMEKVFDKFRELEDK